MLQKEELDTLKTKENIYTILRNKGVSLSQGLDIAEVTIRQSRKLNLSMSLILAVMKKESTFTPYALSSQNAMGIMQVHPITWEEYIGKLNLKVSAHAAFDPVTNIIVATHFLKDLYEYYKKTVGPEEEILEIRVVCLFCWDDFPVSDRNDRIPHQICDGCQKVQGRI